MNTTEKDLFAFKINYNTIQGNVVGVKPLYNGNIAETYYKTGSDNVLRKYGYEYDNLNRLKNAIYQKPGGNTYPTYEDYSEKNITYDKNGNIQTLHRNGNLENALPANQIDKLQYIYKANSNILTSVYDNSGNTSGFKDGSTWGDDYSYDANGNMITDKNKGITKVIYNHLNLPILIEFNNSSTRKITYLYNAQGVKVRKWVWNSDYIPVRTDYFDGFQYKNESLQYFPTAEGYVNNTVISGVNNYKYVFNYTDHLGNVRVSYEKDATSGSLKILEENNYYPFGMKHSGYNSNNLQANYKYKLNNREWQDELGLNVYDFKARQYMQDIGRTTTIDPMAEKFYDLSPQSFLNNNPLRFTDPTGMESDDWVKRNGKIVWDEKVTSATDKDLKKGDEYLGKAVVVFNGSRDEKLGKGNNLFGAGAKLADVTVYGPDGADDVKQYKGFSMSSDFKKFGAIDDGNYTVNFRDPGKTGSLKSNWAINNTGLVNCLDGVNPNPDGASATQKSGVYIHRSNNDGNAYPSGHPCSTGCPLIVPSRNGQNGWNEYNKQLEGVQSYLLIMTGRKK